MEDKRAWPVNKSGLVALVGERVTPDSSYDTMIMSRLLELRGGWYSKFKRADRDNMVSMDELVNPRSQLYETDRTGAIRLNPKRLETDRAGAVKLNPKRHDQCPEEQAAEEGRPNKLLL